MSGDHVLGLAVHTAARIEPMRELVRSSCPVSLATFPKASQDWSSSIGADIA